MRGGVVGLAMLAALAIGHELLARALDDAGLIERLLSPGPETLIAIPAALLLYALRLGLMFVGPGVVLICVLAIAWDVGARRARRRSVRLDARS